MGHQENFWGTNIKEKLEEVIRTEELSYPLRLLDVKLRSLDFDKKSIQPHYWQVIQIHELLLDHQVLPSSYDDVIWYQYLSAYLLLPKIEELKGINSLTWNDIIDDKNIMIIEEAVSESLDLLRASTLKNKLAGQESINPYLKDDIYNAFSKKELLYPINLLEIKLRRLEKEIHYWTIRVIHDTLKYAGVLPAEYSHNFWYRCIAAYILINYEDTKEVLDLNKKGWSNEALFENDHMIRKLEFDC
jgi:hypothetical protein